MRRYFPDETEIRIDPAALAPEDARLYARIVGLPVRERIKDAASQVKATKAHLGEPTLQGGVIVLNSGYYSIATSNFEELVHHSARTDTTQLSFAVCVTSNYTTDGFNSWMNFKFSPAEGGNDVQAKLSMDGRGRALDNVFVERLWRTVKYDEAYLKSYRSQIEAYTNLDAFFRFYNERRPHSAFGMAQPQATSIGMNMLDTILL